jgi:hypothetical protein
LVLPSNRFARLRVEQQHSEPDLLLPRAFRNLVSIPRKGARDDQVQGLPVSLAQFQIYFVIDLIAVLVDVLDGDVSAVDVRVKDFAAHQVAHDFWEPLRERPALYVKSSRIVWRRWIGERHVIAGLMAPAETVVREPNEDGILTGWVFASGRLNVDVLERLEVRQVESLSLM